LTGRGDLYINDKSQDRPANCFPFPIATYSNSYSDQEWLTPPIVPDRVKNAAMLSFNSSTNCQFNQLRKCDQSRKFSALLQFRKWHANLTIATPEIRASPINRSAKYPIGMGSTQNLCCK